MAFITLRACMGYSLRILDERAVVEGPEHRQVIVDDVRHDGLQQGQEDALGGFTQVVVLLRRQADDCRRIDRVAAGV